MAERSSLFAAMCETLGGSEDGNVFLPVQIAGSSIDQRVDDTAVKAFGPGSACPIPAHRVDITLSDGRRVVVEGPTALSLGVGRVQGLVA